MITPLLRQAGTLEAENSRTRHLGTRHIVAIRGLPNSDFQKLAIIPKSCSAATLAI